MNRRQFICRCTQFALAGAAAGVGWGSLYRVAEAALPRPSNDYDQTYRALVCVYLAGGNDAFNMVVPASGGAYANYADSRQSLALPQSSLLFMDGVPYGFHPNCGQLQQMFNTGQLAVMANTGMLIEPTTREDYLNDNVQLPRHLFSHNSQTSQWHSLDPLAVSTGGWGGRMTEHIDTLPPPASTAVTPLSHVSLSGVNAFQRGSISLPYGVGSHGVSGLRGLDDRNTRNARRLQAFNELLDQKLSPARGHIMEQGYASVMRSAMTNAAIVEAALTAQGPLITEFPESRVGQQLRMVAHLVGIREALDLTRQVFFVVMGGFDTHGEQADRHDDLMLELSAALGAFHDATMEVGVEDNVTTFTTSEFGRTLTSNGDGTDHGWGAHHLVMGGSVAGGQIFGTMPELLIEGPDDTRSGRLIPTTSTDQYAATLASWFGVQDDQLDPIFPNLPSFNETPGGRDLGFML